MNVATIEIDRDKAKESYEEYRDALKDTKDAEMAAIARGYRYAAKGHRLLRLSESISQGGVFTDDLMLPRLAIVRAHVNRVWVQRWSSGAVTFLGRHPREISERDQYHRVNLPVGTLMLPSDTPDISTGWWDDHYFSVVPIVPPSLRPRPRLTNYHVMFEVDKWEKDRTSVPVDPILLKHLGGDLYAVLAEWELTELERTVLAGTR